jgi:hypothetical protein
MSRGSGGASSGPRGSSRSDEPAAGPVWGHPWAVAAAAGAALGGGGHSLGLSGGDRAALARLGDERGDTALHVARHLGAAQALLANVLVDSSGSSGGLSPSTCQSQSFARSASAVRSGVSAGASFEAPHGVVGRGGGGGRGRRRERCSRAAAASAGQATGREPRAVLQQQPRVQER